MHTLKLSKFAVSCLIGVAAMFVGCENLQVPITPRIAASPKLPPDYDLPESQFVAAKFNTLASEFLDEYLGQYVSFEGRWEEAPARDPPPVSEPVMG